MDSLGNFLADYYGWIALVSLCTFAGGLIAVPWLLARIPCDYLLTHQEYLSSWKVRRPLLRLCVLFLRNLLGVALALLGIVMLVTPGQGVITLLLGISLTTFPGKRHLELILLRRRGVLKSIDWLRARSNREPLIVPNHEEEPGRD